MKTITRKLINAANDALIAMENQALKVQEFMTGGRF
jgi:hypothetical protein